MEMGTIDECVSGHIVFSLCGKTSIYMYIYAADTCMYLPYTYAQTGSRARASLHTDLSFFSLHFNARDRCLPTWLLLGWAGTFIVSSCHPHHPSTLSIEPHHPQSRLSPVTISDEMKTGQGMMLPTDVSRWN